MFLRPLPVRDPATLLRFDRSAPDDYADNFVYAEVAFYREHTKTLAAVMASSGATVTVDGTAQECHASFVTANFFSELGAAAALGRLLGSRRGMRLPMRRRWWCWPSRSGSAISARIRPLSGRSCTSMASRPPSWAWCRVTSAASVGARPTYGRRLPRSLTSQKAAV